MRVLDPSIDVAAVLDVLHDHYGYRDTTIDFVPVGGDSWCFKAGALWASVRRDRQGHVPQAYEAATLLLEDGHDFVLAPLRGTDDNVVHVAAGFPVVVTPFVVGTTLTGEPAHESQAIERLVTRLHELSVPVALPREDHRFPFRCELDTALSVAAGSDVEAGPYSHRVQELVRNNRDYLTSLIAEADALAVECRDDTTPFVLTHGEPKGNVIRAADGRLLVHDWSSLAFGPPERDWWDFRDLGARVSTRPQFVRFYELRWILGEVAEYTWRFVHPHGADDDDRWMWRELRGYFPASG